MHPCNSICIFVTFSVSLPALVCICQALSSSVSFCQALPASASFCQPLTAPVSPCYPLSAPISSCHPHQPLSVPGGPVSHYQSLSDPITSQERNFVLVWNIKMSFRVEENVYKIKVKSQFLQGGKCGPLVFFHFLL